MFIFINLYRYTYLFINQLYVVWKKKYFPPPFPFTCFVFQSSYLLEIDITELKLFLLSNIVRKHCFFCLTSKILALQSLLNHLISMSFISLICQIGITVLVWSCLTNFLGKVLKNQIMVICSKLFNTIKGWTGIWYNYMRSFFRALNHLNNIFLTFIN